MLWQRLREYLRIGTITFLVGGMIVTIILLLSGFRDPSLLAWQFAATGVLSASIWLANGIIAEEVKISWTERPLLRLIVSLLLTVVATLLLADIVDWLFDNLQGRTRPFSVLRSYTSYYLSVLGGTFIISLFLHGREFLQQLRASIEEREALKRAQISSRYESLKNQVNPHFLFNSLNVLSNLVYKDADLADEFIRRLSGVYRYVLDMQEKEVVSLAEELAMLDAYLFLMKMRFGDNLRIDRPLTARDGEYLPPLSLQMLVENAVKHNIVSAGRPLFLRLERQGEDRLIVTNNLQRKTNVQESLGLGLTNIRERYRYLDRREVEVREEDGQFSVSLPILLMKWEVGNRKSEGGSGKLEIGSGKSEVRSGRSEI